MDQWIREEVESGSYIVRFDISVIIILVPVDPYPAYVAALNVRDLLPLVSDLSDHVVRGS